MGRELDEIDGRVQGSLVEGLTDTDLAYLDKFEGDVSYRTFVALKWLLTDSIAGIRATSSQGQA